MAVTLFFLVFIFLYIIIDFSYGNLKINKIEMRSPKENDIGLIFDIVIINPNNKKKVTCDLRVRGDKCCLELTPDNETFCSGPKLVGGYFGKIQPGAIITVSTIWPTSILFNRKGNCDVTVSSSENATVSSAISDKIYFDTNIDCNKTSAIMKVYINKRKLQNCSTIDLNPFRNCTPMDCEEKYFGQRNYFNLDTNICEIVPKCFGPNIMYNHFQNECVDTTKLITDSDMEFIKSGKLGNSTWNIKRETNIENTEQSKEPRENLLPELWEIGWLTTVDALLIATASIILYISFCFLIFLCFNAITNRQNQKKNKLNCKPNSKYAPQNSSETSKFSNSNSSKSLTKKTL